MKLIVIDIKDISINVMNTFRYFEDFNKPIPREEVAQIEMIMKKAIKKLSSDYLVTICGSYRRGKAESGDIDVLITHPNYTAETAGDVTCPVTLKTIVKCLEKKGLITDTISQGTTKFMVK